MSSRESYDTVISVNNKRDAAIDLIIAALLALSPILQHYIGLYQNAGVTALLICVPILLVKICLRGHISLSRSVYVLPLIIFELYKAFDHGISFGAAAHAIIILILFLAAANACVDLGAVLRISSLIAEAACVLIIVQYICYYILGFHLQLVSVPLLLPSSGQWFDGVRTGLISVSGTANGFYRPSAFFLEPSHFFLYVIPHLALTLMSEGGDRRNKLAGAILLTVGLLFSTSGMGIGCAGLIWVVYLLLYSKEEDRFTIRSLASFKTVFWVVTGLCCAVIAYLKVPFIRSTVQRIFVGDQYGNTAISGRVRQSGNLLAQIGGRELIFGVSKDLSNITYNLSGFANTMYQYGIIGIVLSYFIYVRGVLFQRRQYRMLALIVLIVSFFSAHTHGTFYMCYYVMILLEGFLRERQGLFGDCARGSTSA